MTGLTRRQRYRLRAGPEAAHGGAPGWLREDGIYEGDLGPASQGSPGGSIRLVCPDDPSCCCMVDVKEVEEVE